MSIGYWESYTTIAKELRQDPSKNYIIALITIDLNLHLLGSQPAVAQNKDTTFFSYFIFKSELLF